MPRLNKTFRDMMISLLRRNRLSALAAAEKAEFEVSTSTISLWRRGMVPLPHKVEKLKTFLSYFPDEDVDKWLAVIDAGYEEDMKS